MDIMDSMNTSEIRKTLEEASGEVATTTATQKNLVSSSISRRRLLQGAAAGVAGTTLAGAATFSLLNAGAVHAASASSDSILKEYFSILATGEALFVTLYSNAIAHYQQLNLHGNALNALEAIRAEEQIHYNFAVANGGVPATTHFSMPHGAETFEDQKLFLETQQLGEDLTNGALVAWIKDMAKMGYPRLAQIGGQLMQVEGGHRVVGRFILNAEPWDNWAFGPVVLSSFLQVPAAVKAAGFLSPVKGNDFAYHAVEPSFPGVIYTTP
jgi:hypothetical protein